MIWLSLMKIVNNMCRSEEQPKEEQVTTPAAEQAEESEQEIIVKRRKRRFQSLESSIEPEKTTIDLKGDL